MSIVMRRRAAVAAIAAAFAALPWAGAPAAEYFAGKRIVINVGLPAGGGYDLYARLLAHHWPRHIPGSPGMIVQNRPGAGSVTAANYVYSVAVKDGTQLAMTLNVTPIFQVLGVSGVKYDVAKMGWIGNMSSQTGLMVAWHTAPATTMAAVRQREIIVGTTGGRQGEAFIYATMMKAFTGAKFKIVGGYGGSAALDPALARGEIHARSVSWNSYMIAKPDWIANKLVIPLVQVGLKKDPNLPHIPFVTEFATSEDGRKVLELISSTSGFSRAFWGPPGMPKEALEILRKSFDATVNDPGVRADAAKRKFVIDPLTGAEVEALAKKTLTVPPGVVKAARAAMDGK